MENAADALKMVLGIFMFVLGLTVFFYMTEQVRATSDIVLYESDKTNFYNMDKLKGNNTDGNRTVTLEAIIPNIYRYYTESIGITIIDPNGEEGYKFVRYSTSDDERVGTKIYDKDSNSYKSFNDYYDEYIVNTIGLNNTIVDYDTIVKPFYEKCFGGDPNSDSSQAVWRVGANIQGQDARIKRVYADVTGKIVNINGKTYTGINLQDKFGENKKFTETFKEAVVYEEKTGTIDTKKKRSVIEIIYIAQ